VENLIIMSIKKILIGLVVLLVLLPALSYLRIVLRPPITTDLSKVILAQDLPPEVVENNKVLVQDYFAKLYSADYATAIRDHLADTYKEHQISANFSKQGLAATVAKQLSDYPQQKVTVHRVIAQGDLIFLHVEQKLNPQTAFARAELFRVVDNKIIEHWSASQLIPTPPPVHGMLGGAKVNLSSNAGRTYLKQALQSSANILNYNFAALPDQYTATYTQHTPDAKDGVGGFLFFVRLMQVLDVFGFTPTITPKVALAEGDFMVVFTFCDIPPIQSNALSMDILRVTADGKNDEHWDVIEMMSSKELAAQAF
jgi:predicted SnoaL-like aldol condensation-catalyzing enzyme